MQKALVRVIVAVVIFTVGCSKGGESDDLSVAQKCLNDVPDSDPSQAGSCMSSISKYDDPQANILKCAITVTYGGLTETRLAQAYTLLSDTSQTNQTATFMAAMSLTNPDLTTGYALAKQANQYCLASGETGLIYLSDLVVTGTYMNLTIESLTGSGIDLSDPSGTNSAVSSFLTTCGGASPPASCTQDLSTVGSTATNLVSTYCGTSGADQTVCGQASSAVQDGAGNPAATGQALFCTLQNKTYNSTTNACN
jgi:hypothetical protein